MGGHPCGPQPPSPRRHSIPTPIAVPKTAQMPKSASLRMIGSFLAGLSPTILVELRWNGQTRASGQLRNRICESRFQPSGRNHSRRPRHEKGHLGKLHNLQPCGVIFTIVVFILLPHGATWHFPGHPLARFINFSIKSVLSIDSMAFGMYCPGRLRAASLCRALRGREQDGTVLVAFFLDLHF